MPAFSSRSYEKLPFVTAVSPRSDIFWEEGGGRWGFCGQGWSYAAVLICTTTLQACKRKLEPLLFKGKEFIFFISRCVFFNQLPFTDRKAVNSHKTQREAITKPSLSIDMWASGELIYIYVGLKL